MPIEIRELIIQAVVSSGTGAADDPWYQDDDEASVGNAAPLPRDPRDDRQAIIQECVRQVLRILQQKKER